MQTSTTAKDIYNYTSLFMHFPTYFAHCTSPQCMIPENIHTHPNGKEGLKSQNTNHNWNFQI